MFVGFGSMSPDDAARAAGVATAAARQAGMRLVLQSGRAGLDVAGPADDSIVIGDVPHDWLFPRMAAVVHHAGAGTTGAGLRAGVPAVTVPQIGDQPFWAARIAALGAGPPPIRYRQLSVPVLAAAIQDAVTRPSYRDPGPGAGRPTGPRRRQRSRGGGRQPPLMRSRLRPQTK